MSEDEDRRFRVGLAVADRLAAEPPQAAAESTRLSPGSRSTQDGLDVVRQQDWWRDASPDVIAAMYETARVRDAFDQRATRATDRIRQEVYRRYGIDMRRPYADQDAVDSALAERAQLEREVAVLDLTDAAQAMAQACAMERAGNTRVARARRERGDRLYQAAERHHRRAALATACLTDGRSEVSGMHAASGGESIA